MKNKLFLAISLLALAFTASGQVALTQTTVTNAITVNQQTFAVASSTGMTANNPKTILYLIEKGGTNRGELMTVTAVNSATSITVARGAAFRSAHAAGAFLVIGNSGNNAASFQSYNPVGSCTAAQTLFTPWINTNTGEQWLCSTKTLTWVPGWNNANPKSVTADVASAAGAITPSGPIFHITGTAAVTGFTLPVGFSAGCFTTINDAAWTWTTAGNIGDAGTAVALETITFCYDTSNSKWYGSHLAA